MRFVTLLSELTLHELHAMADGVMEDTVTDMDFLETLAAYKCFLVPPWVMRASPTGGLSKVTQLYYDEHGEIDKSKVLVAAARQFRREHSGGSRFGGRFDI
jgi:hypothetical protein